MTTTHRLILAGLAVGLLSTTTSAKAQQSVELTSETERFKCYVTTTNARRSIIYFYTLQTLPERFNDAETVALAEIPDSVRARLQTVTECAREDLRFRDPFARSLEPTQPQ